MSKSKSLGYTVVQYDLRTKMKVSVTEYALLDIVHKLTRGDKNECYMSKASFGMRLGISERAVYNLISRLVKQRLLNNKKGLLSLTTKGSSYFEEESNNDEKKLHSSSENSSKDSMNKVQKRTEQNSSNNNRGNRKTEKEKKLSESEEIFLDLLIQEVQSLFKGSANTRQIKEFLMSKFADNEIKDFALAIWENKKRKAEETPHIDYWGFFIKEWKQYTFDDLWDEAKGVSSRLSEEQREYFAQLREKAKKRVWNQMLEYLLDEYCE